MSLDFVSLNAFYKSPLGMRVQSALNEKLARLWPVLEGERVAGLGFAHPYLDPWRGRAGRLLALMPAAQGVGIWPDQEANASALILEDMLPLPEASIDRLLLVHMLEAAGDPQAVLREAWRVMAPGGRLIAVVPNRRGLWARAEHAPFGHGRPFTRIQLAHLLRESRLSPLRWDDALHFFPWVRGSGFFASGRMEKLGRHLWPRFSGVLLVEATKELYQGIPVARRARAPLLRPALIPTSDRYFPIPYERIRESHA